MQAVLDESAEVLRAAHGVLICETRHGFVCANAGRRPVERIGRGDELILLPEDPDASARRAARRDRRARGVRPAVVIADSFGRAWRLGQTDVAIGAAGLVPLDEWSGRPDAHGRELRATSIAVADSVAAAADLARARTRASRPCWCAASTASSPEDGPGAAALRRPPEEDLFRRASRP